MMSGKKKRTSVECDLSQIDGLPALLEVAKYIGDAKEVVGRTLPRFQCVVDSGAQLIGQGLTTIRGIVEIVEFLEARRDKFPGLFPVPSARAKLAPHPWGNAQHPPTAKRAKRSRVVSYGYGRLTLAEKDRIRFRVVLAEDDDEYDVPFVLARITGEFGITRREINQLMRRANGAFAKDFAVRVVAMTLEILERPAIARKLADLRPQIGNWKNIVQQADVYRSAHLED